MSKPRLLVVTFVSPPSTAIAGLRWWLMTKYLERLGHDVTVVTSSAHGRVRGEDEEQVIRTKDLASVGGLRRLLRRPSLHADDGATAVDTPPPRLLTSVVVPDAKLLSWVPFALHAGRRMVRDRGIDCVITTSPPESTHIVGAFLRRLGPAWVADFRDGWTFEPTRKPFPTRLQRALDRRIEASVVRRADATVAVTEELSADLKTRLGTDAVCVPNAWDPELEGEATDIIASVHERLRIDRPTLVYTGILGFETDRHSRSEAFLRAFARYSATADGNELQLVIAGRPAASELAFLSSLDCRTITHIGLVSRRDAHRLQKSATALLLIGSVSSAATGKLYEYLGTGRPILHIGGPSAAARILAETGRGVTVSAHDEDAIIRELRRIASGEFAAELAPRGIERYSYPFVAEQMADVVEDAIRRRALERG